MRIWKYTLRTKRSVIEMPAGAKLLDVQMQHGACCLWALIDETAPMESRTIALYDTGELLPDEPGNYIATVQMHGGVLVSHAFELIAPGTRKGAAS
jgi:hypothetical protein